MIYLVCALAVYKTLHVILALLTREVMPWVKVTAGVILSVVSVGLVFLSSDAHFEYGVVLSALAVATLAGLTHTVIRLLTYLGDMAARKAIR